MTSHHSHIIRFPRLGFKLIGTKVCLKLHKATKKEQKLHKFMLKQDLFLSWRKLIPKLNSKEMTEESD
jgi:hypothetical protein